MSATRIVTSMVWVVSAVVTGCSDGGPPGAHSEWTRTRSHSASEAAADGGMPRAREDENANAQALAALCDGSPGITFSALAVGGGQPQPGTQVMAENGYNFLIVEGDCHYWALQGMLAHVTTGRLSKDQARDVVEAFELDQWALNTGSTSASDAEGPTYHMLF